MSEKYGEPASPSPVQRTRTQNLHAPPPRSPEKNSKRTTDLIKKRIDYTEEELFQSIFKGTILFSLFSQHPPPLLSASVIERLAKDEVIQDPQLVTAGDLIVIPAV
jgi:hypothetical protein